MALRVVIIEDEPLIAEQLCELLMHTGHGIIIEQHLSSVEEGIDYFTSQKEPDLIFSDIRLGDGLSFDIFIQCSISVPVVFCTAYDQYMLEAFKSNGIDYLLKPIQETALMETLDRFKRVFEPLSVDSAIHEELRQIVSGQTSNRDASLLARKGEYIIPVRFSDIHLVYLDDRKTHVRTVDNKTYRVSETLEMLQSSFGATHFRLNRKHIIHRDAVEKVAHYFSRKLLVIPKIPYDHQLLVSKANARSFLEWLGDGPLD